MRSIQQVPQKLTGILGSFGIDTSNFDFLGGGSERQNDIMCFYDPSGDRICEEIPNSDELNCNSDGLCSVYLSNIEESNPVEEIARKYNLRAYTKKKDGVQKKALTGVVKKDDIQSLKDDLALDLEVKESDQLRKVKLGDFTPPQSCQLNPLGAECERYLASPDWFWVGPFSGWIKADGFVDALKKGIAGIEKKKTKVESHSNVHKNSESSDQVLTTV